MTDDIHLIPVSQLPRLITDQLVAHRARDAETAVAAYADDATVTDEGHTYRGRSEIADWLRSSASEYTFTSELIAARRVDGEHYVAIQHLEGDFPGGVVDLNYRFTLRDGKIRRLTIEP